MRLRGFSAALAAILLTAGGWSAAPAAARADVYRAIANENVCIDVNQSNLKLGIYNCHGQANQNFLTPAYGQQRFTVNGQVLCMDQGSNSQGADIVMRACNPNANSQRWGQSAGASSATVIKNEAGWCMDIPGGDAKDGQRLEIWACNGGANQQFFRKGPGGAATAAPGGGCANGDIARAVQEVTGRAPRGSGNSGECEAGQYRGFSSYADLVNKVAVKLTGKGVAYVFVAPKLAIMQGHVGWAWLGDDLLYHLGSTDAPITNFNVFQKNFGFIITEGRNTNTPWRTTASTEQEMLDRFRQHGSTTDSYTEFKKTFVASRNSAYADQRQNEAANWGYGLVGNNCADHTYRVLEAYGVNTSGVMRSLMTRGAPNSWFRAFGGMALSGSIRSVTNEPGILL